ncbi:molybdenum cofactor guanylyltransferase MobA [Candidatus Methylacidithermus pantelleriae]|uniref:Probable molybdenum cofactor guanylyltransferase n=1 Tax=Candidatus Methylacidithermus pantelleriae TaxID=2744239 RepID=A0A8J2BKL5_9BACT|nr:molybdenum cofactor guanylyltransferase MobA [Candidatus Methylacidithermus pantelleriae]CAF0693612.1 Molybdenum cofactor guanylyltransferase [Candidatus Methylacidithermus pantelleriae]
MGAGLEVGITGVILAGGKGSRMGGVDKGLVALSGRPLIRWVLDRLGPQVDHLLISANRNQDCYASLGVPVVSDREPWTGVGPLGGIARAMEEATDPFVMVVPCDAPFVFPDLVGRLFACCQRTGKEMAIAHDGRRPQNLFALLRRDLVGRLHEYLSKGNRKVEGFFTPDRTAWEFFRDSEIGFFNINSSQDLAWAENLLSGKMAKGAEGHCET